MGEIFTKAIDILYFAKQNNIEILLNGDQLQLKVPEDKTIDKDLFEEIRANKQLIIDYLRSDNLRSTVVSDKESKIERFDRDVVKYIPLSFSQERLWFIDKLEGSVQYNQPSVLRLTGELDTAVLEQTIQTIISRHEVLRTVIKEHEGQGYQEVITAAGWQLTRTTGKDKTEKELSNYIGQLIGQPFDLSKDYKLRAELIMLSGEEHVLVVTMHHIASDGWSKAILVKEVAELYAAYTEKRTPNLPALPIQYADYALWQREYMQGEVLEEKLGYWKNKLEGVPPLELPSDYSRPAIQRLRGAAHYFEIEEALSKQVQALSQKNGATLYMTLLAAFNVLLYQYSGQEDICVGTTVAGRSQQELEGLIGFFINTMALRNQVNGKEPFTKLLQEIKQTTLEAYAHQEVPFEKVVDAVVRERDTSRNPLFQVLFSLQNTPESPGLKLGNLSLRAEGQEHITSRFDIAFMVREGSRGIQVTLEYNTDLYTEERISAMAEQFAMLLSSITQSPDQAVGELRIIPKAEEARITQAGAYAVLYPREATIPQLITSQSKRSPNNISVVYEGQQISYQALEARSNQLAHYLQERGVERGTLVPMLMERGIEMVIGMLGIQKAGGAYVPMDTEFPQDRIGYMVEDTKAKLVLSSSESSGKLNGIEGIEILELDEARSALRVQPDTPPETGLAAEDTAYVIYTSGSTGKPKGVSISHRNLTDYTYGLEEKIKISESKSFALVSSIATDLGNTVLYGSLLTGGGLHVLNKETVSQVADIHEYFERNEIDCTKIVPSHWQALTLDNKPLLPKQLLIFGGEALQAKQVAQIRAAGTGTRIVNHYGPTETTIGKLLHEVDKDREYTNSIPIGKPFSNTRVYVISKEGRLCPIGVPGQLYIAGDGVSEKGYLNQPELTAEKFIQDPYSKTGNKGEKMYGTGDRVVQDTDGNITFIGRVDDQVKIRGYRVEPGEAGRVLQESGLVAQAIVLATDDKQGNKQLTGYIIPNGNSQEEIYSYLKAQLPDYMVPSQLMELERFPMTANGKIDRKALPDPEGTQTTNRYEAPQTETEERLSHIWEEILEVDRVGRTDDFFAIGGHSLLAVRLVSAIRKQFGAELAISEVFDYPTVGQLAIRIEEKQSTGEQAPGITAVSPRPAYIPLSFSQERLWFIDKLEGSVQYHTPSVLKLKGKLNLELLEKTLRAIIGRHEVLRTVLSEHEGVGYQHIISPDNWSLNITEAVDISDKKNEETLFQYISELIRKPFDLSKDYMLRADLIKTGEADHVLVVTLHHIASDGWSKSVLVRELVELYASFEEKRTPILPGLPIQYADYAIWQRDNLSGGVLEAKLDYWKSKLRDVSPLELPTDYSRPAIQTLRGNQQSFKIDSDLSTRLMALSQQRGTTLFMTLLAAFKVLLYRYSGQEDICIGTGIAGRQQQELEGLIGFFVNTLALRTEVNGGDSFTKLLQSVKITTLEAYKHQEIPFEKVVDLIVKERDLSRNPLIQVMFMLQNTPEVPALNIGAIGISAYNFEHITSRFDITFSIIERGNNLDIVVEYRTDLFELGTIERMVGHYKELLNSIISNPDTQISKLSILSSGEKGTLLQDFNDTIATYPKDKNIVSLFEEQVKQNPEAVAIVFEDNELTYQELNRRANHIARYLQSKGVKSETLVPICIERGLDMIAGILGILKAGAVYVPVDPEYPAERISYMLEDTGANLVISSKESREKVKDITSASIIELDGDWEIIKKEEGGNLYLNISPEQLAYIIYTSGSTGKPKGVMIEHYNVVRLFKTDPNLYDFDKNDVWTLFHSFCFDFSVWEMYGALFYGGKLVIVPKDVTRDAALFSELLLKEKVTILNQTPSAFYNLQDAFSEKSVKAIPIRDVIFGGEALNPGKLKFWKESYPECRIINMYGITETTVHVTYQEIEWQHIQKGNSIIGKPIPTLSIYVLNNDKQLQPIGVAGELYVGGSGLARGYLNRAELTAERFIDNPFSNEGGSRLYKTGDLGRWLADGNIEYLGRIDDQVKIRGFRIELGEIESALNQSEQVNQAVVLAKEDGGGDKILLSYYVPDWQFIKAEERIYYQRQVATWKDVYEVEYEQTEDAKDIDEEFNIIGWNDSFTGLPIPAEHMRIWLDDTVKLILSENPEHVLEIGSGTGLIFYQLAGKVKKYLGTDLSRSSINQITARVNKGFRDYGAMELWVSPAHEVSLPDGEYADTIILNSIIQYFPGEGYMDDVIARSLSVLKDGGRIIIGDVRDNRLLAMFKARLQMQKMQSSSSIQELNWAIEQDVLKEEELCLSPEYFYNLKLLYPQITHVNIEWKHGDYINELTLYRYNVVIYVGIEKPVISPNWKNWESVDKQNIIDQLTDGFEIIAIKDAPNPRLWKEKLLNQALQRKTTSSLGDVSEAIENEDSETLLIREILSLAEANGYQYRLLLDEDIFKVNILIEKAVSAGFIQSIYQEDTPNQIEPYANIPLFTDISSDIKKGIRFFLQQSLPDYMIPHDFIAVKQLPLTSNGKVDRRFLSLRENIAFRNTFNYQPASSLVEQKLVNIWKELLNVERVGIYDNFFELGGHSLLAMRLVSAIRKQIEIELAVKEIFNYPTIILLAERLSGEAVGEPIPQISAIHPRPEYIPLSFSQERLWFIDKLEGSVQYHTPSVLKLKGALNAGALERSLQTIIERHEVLRTVYHEDSAGSGYQEVIGAEGWTLGFTDQTGEDKAGLSTYISELIRQPFDLSKDYMLRAELIKTGEAEHILVLTMHHIASDGWSVSVLVREVVELYSAYTEKRVPKLPLLPIQYADYALWQREYMKEAVLEAKLGYWKEKLSGVPPLELPADHVRPAIAGRGGSKRAISIDKDLSEQLQALSRRHGATLYMTLLAAFNTLLYRYSGQEDICVGTPVAGRSLQEVEGLIGFFINTLALRSHVNGNEPFTGLLERIKQTTLEAYSHQEVPFERVVDAVVKERDMSRSPLFQVMFNLVNTPDVQQTRLPGLELSPEAGSHTTAKFDITFIIRESPAGIHGTVEYRTDLYEAETIDRLTGHYLNLLRSITIRPEETIGKLNLLGRTEEETLLKTFNDTTAAYPKEKSIVTLFEEQAAKTPDATAIVFEGAAISYKELNEKSNQLSAYLITQGVQKETLVPICMERGPWMLTGILGILKAGGAYVPVDGDYPAERIGYMLEDTHARLILSSKAGKEKLSGITQATVIALDEDREEIEKEAGSKQHTEISAEDLAYVMYTSGSTGRPKGVMVTHRNVTSLVKGNHYVKLDEQSVLLATGSPSFDATTFEYWGMLLNGGKLILSGAEELQDSEKLKGNIEEHKVTTMWFTSSWFNQLADSSPEVFAGLKTVLAGGEKLSEQHIEKIGNLYPELKLVNGYGPTENTTFSLTYAIENNNKENKGKLRNPVPVGKPLNNRTAYILTAENGLSPVGVTGEICVGGDGLSRGYLNQPTLTAEKFIKDPFSTNPNGRLYKTGDLGRWLADGNIEYQGRKDEQVKLRGYRIELGEIESVLNQVPGVQQGVVLAKENKQGAKMLVGYVVTENNTTKENIREYLSTKLPEYMVPAIWVEVEQIPLTANGKADKRALPDPELGDITVEYIAPRNATEEKLATIWQELLGIAQIGIYDNFFELGGHSLLAMRVVSAIRKELNVELSVRDLFVNPDIAGLGKHLAEQSTAATSLLPQITAGERPEHIPLSFSQERLWFIDKLGGSVQYHIPAVLRLTGNLNKEALFAALQNVVRRHEVLRTVYLEDAEGIGYQQIMTAEDWVLTYEDRTESTDKAMLEWHIKEMVKAPFNLSKDYMLRAELIQEGEADHILVVTMHHIASDGWSVSVLVKEVVEIYESYIEGRATYLPLLPIQYADYSIWQRSYMQGEILAEKIGYWKSKLQGVLPLELPTDYLRPSTIGTAGGNISVSIDKERLKQIHIVSQQHGATLYMTLLSAFKVLLYRYSGQEDICVGTPIAGRQQQEVEGLIGFFINTLAMRSRVNGEKPFSELLGEVKNTTLEAYSHQEIPFEKVVDAVVKERDMSRSPLFQVMFTLQNTPDVPELKLGGITLQGEKHSHNTSKFDIAFILKETPNGIQGTVEYSTDLYKEDTVRRMINHFEALLQSIGDNPLTQVGRLKMLDESEETQLLKTFNATEIKYPKEKSIVTVFEEQVSKTPKAAAVIFEGVTLSYSELNERSNQLAHYLQKKGVSKETLVPICIERGPLMIIGILGILKAGGAYVPIDPEYPAERISYMLEDTGAKLIVSTTKSKEKLSETGGQKVIDLEAEQQDIAKEDGSNLNTKIAANQLAYVIYTSGSTGKPKGVMIEHGNTHSFIAWCRDEFASSQFNVAYATTSMCFDLSVFEMFYPLSTGKPIRILENGLAIADYLAKDSAVLINTVPSVIEHLLNEKTDLGNVTVINMAGEPIPLRVSEGLDKRNIEVRNLYGPTEDTTYSTIYRLEKGKPVTIGKPISNTKIYILNADKQLSPVGVTGEICIGGDGLARGYLNKPELTAEKFVENPFHENSNARLYKTGDIGRWLPDGNIEYLGRIDDQVKVRGFRIELGEIESALNENPFISQAVVLAKADKKGTKRLVGYVVTAAGQFDKQAVQEYLRTSLPEYMVPALWVQLDQIPLTPNGKTDKRALPDPEITDKSAEYVAPRNETEWALAAIWQELLGIERVGIYDNFFELGGHSILAMRIITKIRRKVSEDITVKELFVYPTIAGLSGYLKRGDKKTQQSLIPIKASGSKAPLYIVCGAGGTVFTFREFAHMLDADQPVYGLQQPTEISELEGMPNTIESIAEKYVKEIITSNPEGPYALSGHCIGGIIAFEMAKQLEAMDKKVSMLAMLDTVVSEKHKAEPGTLKNLYHLPHIAKKTVSNILTKVKFEIFLLTRYPKQALLYKAKKARLIMGNNQPKPENIDMDLFNKISGMIQRASSNYEIKPYDGDMVVFYAKEHYYFMDRMNKVVYKELSYSDDTLKAWGKYAQSVETYEVDGEHSAIFDPKYAVKLADILQQHLDEGFITTKN